MSGGVQVVSTTRQIIAVGGRVFTDLANIKILGTFVSTSGNHGTFREQDGSSGFQVGASTTFKIHAVKLFSEAAATNLTSVSLAYADNDVGFDSATALTNGVYQFGASTFAAVAMFGDDGYPCADVVTRFDVPSNKYAQAELGGTSNSIHVQVFGYEE